MKITQAKTKNQYFEVKEKGSVEQEYLITHHSDFDSINTYNVITKK